MDILVFVKQVPDLVEDLEIDPSGQFIDREETMFVLSEPDSHALEEAALLKERHGGTITAMTVDIGDADETLFGAIARGADKAIKITGDYPDHLESHQVALAAAGAAKEVAGDLILVGSQAIDDLDDAPGALLAGYLDLPYVGVVSAVKVEGNEAIVSKELSGGVLMEIKLQLPAVVGIQSAEQPPRYVPVSRVRQVMRSATIDEQDSGVDFAATIGVRSIQRPEPSSVAEMIEGDADEVADRILEIIRERGILR
jgi:electron transfer flavoprotein beta subunit